MDDIKGKIEEILIITKPEYNPDSGREYRKEIIEIEIEALDDSGDTFEGKISYYHLNRKKKETVDFRIRNFQAQYKKYQSLEPHEKSTFESEFWNLPYDNNPD